MRYVVFETDLFFTDIPDNQLDHWFIGADCAGWFYARLLPYREISQHLDPTMEDWGWIIAIKTNKIVVDICVWEYLDQRKNWLLGIGAKKRFLKKIDQVQLDSAEQTVEAALNSILQSDNRFSMVRWSDDNPMERPTKALDGTL